MSLEKREIISQKVKVILKKIYGRQAISFFFKDQKSKVSFIRK